MLVEYYAGREQLLHSGRGSRTCQHRRTCQPQVSNAHATPFGDAQPSAHGGRQSRGAQHCRLLPARRVPDPVVSAPRLSTEPRAIGGCTICGTSHPPLTLHAAARCQATPLRRTKRRSAVAPQHWARSLTPAIAARSPPRDHREITAGSPQHRRRGHASGTRGPRCSVTNDPFMGRCPGGFLPGGALVPQRRVATIHWDPWRRR